MKCFAVTGFLFLLLVPANSGRADEQKPVRTIVQLYDGDHPYARQMSQRIRGELAILAENHYDLKYLPDETAGWDPSKAEPLLTKYLRNPEVDLILVSGPLLSQAVKIKIPLSKPVVITSLLDPDILGFPRTPEGSSGTPNLYYAAKTKSVEGDLEAFRKIYRFKTVHFLVEDVLRPYVQKITENLRKNGFEAESLPASGSVPEILARIDQAGVDALYLTPLMLAAEEHENLIHAINQRKIPTFSYSGYEEVRQGALACRTPKRITKFARRMAMTIDRIFEGEDAGTLPVRFELEDKIVINQKTANQIGLSIPFDVLMQAELLFQDETPAEMLSMHQAVDEALKNNLNFRIFDEQIKSASKNYWLAWTNYLPLLNFRLDYDVFDSERAKDLGFPKWNYGYGLSLNQLIFSHPIFFQISNTKKQVKIEKLQRDTSILDITDQTVRAYLDYLRAKSLRKVERDNLKTTETNLSMAEKRQKTGVAGPEEVFRWQAERADDQSNLLRRDSDVYKARVVLNQLMNRRQEEMFDEQEVGLETVQYYIGGKNLDPYVRNFRTLLAFLEFSVQYSFRHSPELAALEVGIEQQKNNVRSADGRFALPEAAFDGDLRHKIKDKNYGPETINQSDDWEFRIRMTYPF
ncbi:MAG TPA: ABC transporter substrate binding protein, partial [bacterium]|nr:ABC transporter substrate binding protein [bacterium]